jgi:hypothetical protein
MPHHPRPRARLSDVADARRGRPQVLRRQSRPVGLAVAAGIGPDDLRRAADGLSQVWVAVRGDRVRVQVLGGGRVHAPPRLVARIAQDPAGTSLDGTIQEHPLTVLWPSFYGVLSLFCLVAAVQVRTEGSTTGLVLLVLAAAVFGAIAAAFARSRRRGFDRDVAVLVRAVHGLVQLAGLRRG